MALSAASSVASVPHIPTVQSEMLGPRERALEAYEDYLSLMRDADATFRPQLQLARARLNALRDAAGAPLTPR